MKRTLSLVLAVMLVFACFAAFAVNSSAASYVTDGLVANYDASKIANGETTWTDDSGNGNDIVDMPNTDTCFFKDGGYHLDSVRIDLPDAIDTVMGGEEFTVEMHLHDVVSLATSFNTFINCPSDDFSLFRRVNNDNLEIKLHPNARPMVADGLNLLQDSTVTVTFKVGEKSCLYVNGELVSEADASTAKLANTSGMFFGHDDASRNFTAVFKAMRFYSKALSADEVKANYAVDTASESVTPVEPSQPDTPVVPEKPTTKGENLLAGLKYTSDGVVRSGGYSDYADENTCKYLLTDGTWSARGDEDGIIGGYDTKGATSFVFDLGKKTAIAGFKCDGFSNDSWGISVPNSVEFLVSDDGENYTSVGVVTASEGQDVGNGSWLKYDFSLEKAVSGKFIKVVYTSAAFTWLSEIEAYAAGTSDTTSKPETPVTADNGIVALAVIASIAVAGAVVIKKSR